MLRRAEIEVTLSGGSTLVPDLAGQTYDAALQLLRENNLSRGKVEYGDAVTDDKIGAVLQSSQAGTMAVLDTQVTTIGAKAKRSTPISTTVPADTQRSRCGSRWKKTARWREQQWYVHLRAIPVIILSPTRERCASANLHQALADQQVMLE